MNRLDQIMYLLGKQQALKEIEKDAKTVNHSIDKKEVYQMKNMRRPVRKITAIAAVVIVLCTALTIGISAAGTKYFKLLSFKDRVGYGPHIESKGELDTIENNNLKITLTNTHLGGNVLYVTFDVETLDKTPMQVLTDAKRTEISTFEKCYLEYNGVKYETTLLFRMDDGSVPYKATYEAAFHSNKNRNVAVAINPKEISNKQVSFIVENLRKTTYEDENIGFKFDSLADVYNQLPGNVYFSEKYPNAYIDKIEFKKGGWDTESVLSYIYINPGSEKAKKDFMEKLCYQDLTTGISGMGRDLFSSYDTNTRCIYEDGDHIYIAIPAKDLEDMTIDDLENLRFIFAGTRTDDYFEKGKWTLQFTTNSADEPLTFKGNKEATLKNGYKITVTDISLTSTDIEYSFEGDIDLLKLEKFYIVLKDGTEVDLGSKIGGGGNTNTGEYSLYGILETLIDLNQVRGMRFGDTIVELK